MKDDLVEQLRDEAGRNGGQGAYAWRSRELCGKAAAKILSLQSQLAAAQEKLARAEGVIKNAQHIFEECSVTFGVCCCGDDMEIHAEPMSCGHSPVDQGAYSVMRWQEEASTTLAALREPAAEVGSV